jgi:CO/xanthine dehydrogenase FAD-binding subunit
VTQAAEDNFVAYIAHDEFRRGLPHGHFRIIVNPQLVRPYIVQRTHVNVLAMAFIGVGAVLALAGQALPGVLLVALGIVANRVVRHQAAKIALHLALKDPAVYAEVTSNGVMEVRRAG